MVIIYTGMFLSGLKSEVIELHNVMSGYFYSSGKPKGITSLPLMLFKKGMNWHWTSIGEKGEFSS